MYSNDNYGVFIQSAECVLYPVDRWDGTQTANGVAVITDKIKLVISLSCTTSELTWAKEIINGVMQASSGEIAITDYAGQRNTQLIINQLGKGNAPAVDYCINYIFPNGQNGYLGAAGEWKAVFDNKSAIMEAFNILGVIFGATALITSTQVDKTTEWAIYWGNGSLTHNYDSVTCRTCAFAPLISNPKIINFTIAGTTYQCLEGTTWEQWCKSSFNTHGYAVSNGRIETANGLVVTTVNHDSGEVGITDVIIADKTYYTIRIPL